MAAPRRVVLILASILGLGAIVVPRPAAPSAATALGDAAQAWLRTLDGEQRSRAVLAFAGEERTKWNFVPGEYAGLPLGAMALPTRRAAHDLLRTVLSSAGYLRVTAVMALDAILRELEEANGRKAPHRDPERYSFAVFGAAGGGAPWGLRVQGHHVSLNLSVDPGSGAVSVTPLFLGTNPHEVRTGARAGSRVLGDVEDLGFGLLGSLREEQRAAAILDARAPADVILGPARAADFLGAPRGLAWASLDAAQAATLQQLVATIVGSVRDDLAASELDAIARADKTEVCFAWLGATERGKPHYFRVQGPTFAFEYDNVQNEANHVHLVWRLAGRDFGADWLAAHHAAEHGRGK